jgi:hypothetical protein
VPKRRNVIAVATLRPERLSKETLLERGRRLDRELETGFSFEEIAAGLSGD